jgi:SAM-dependent methyltransferase
MQQTPVHDLHNPDLLSVMEASTRKVLEVGCMSGALAREFKKIAPHAIYTGVEIDASYAELATKYCDSVYTLNIDEAPDYFWKMNSSVDAWIFGDVLEHLKDPWRVLSKINQIIPKDGYIAACIPNAQHWSLQARLSMGDFTYENSGLLDRTHLRWFTRRTIHEMFENTGFKVVQEIPRIFQENNTSEILKSISHTAALCGFNPELAMKDAIPLQYVIKAVPM